MAIRIIGEFTQFHADRFARALSSAMTEQFAPPGVEYTVTAKKRMDKAELHDTKSETNENGLALAYDIKNTTMQ